MKTTMHTVVFALVFAAPAIFADGARAEDTLNGAGLCENDHSAFCFERSDTPGMWFFREGWAREKGAVRGKGPVVKGKTPGYWFKHGHWVEWSTDHPYRGSIEREGPYVKGLPHGQWVIKTTGTKGSRIQKGQYVNGVRHGRWHIITESSGLFGGREEKVIIYE
ncbi:MAG: hypothetical protein MPK11_08935 [Gammaproteobacteria bacterium]|nr:hypothetical protein [Gammaproteobacteria bacterium]MDA7970874.1 hypothetical protein [Gammaproteobacteria bacterium]MDA7972394.1 hypothetical protein [Gammaproteobacteria bacterium]MDA7995582.1 hypothetical protein [Gammaproteobacteria bacterium]CAJ2377028.1 MAG: exported hypothetical protein [Arenicellales bacterium IbO2]